MASENTLFIVKDGWIIFEQVWTKHGLEDRAFTVRFKLENINSFGVVAEKWYKYKDKPEYHVGIMINGTEFTLRTANRSLIRPEVARMEQVLASNHNELRDLVIELTAKLAFQNDLRKAVSNGLA